MARRIVGKVQEITDPVPGVRVRQDGRQRRVFLDGRGPGLRSGEGRGRVVEQGEQETAVTSSGVSAGPHLAPLRHRLAVMEGQHGD